MDPIDVTVREGKFRLEGFPHAVKAITLDEPEAELLGDLALHHIDLRFAAECLAALDAAPETPDPLREALWRSALVAYFKCFTSSKARRKLDVSEIYKNESPLAVENFNHLKALRDKHIVHDENAWSQVRVVAILNRPDADRKIARVGTPSFAAVTLDAQSAGALRQLTAVARAYVASEFDMLCDALTDHLEAEPYDELLGRPEPDFSVPTVEKVAKNRKS